MCKFWLVVEPTPLKNMLVKMGSSSPKFEVNIKKIFELQPPSIYMCIIVYIYIYMYTNTLQLGYLDGVGKPKGACKKHRPLIIYLSTREILCCSF